MPHIAKLFLKLLSCKSRTLDSSAAHGVSEKSSEIVHESLSDRGIIDKKCLDMIIEAAN